MQGAANMKKKQQHTTQNSPYARAFKIVPGNAFSSHVLTRYALEKILTYEHALEYEFERAKAGKIRFDAGRPPQAPSR
jgi:hypothetical protein